MFDYRSIFKIRRWPGSKEKHLVSGEFQMRVANQTIHNTYNYIYTYIHITLWLFNIAMENG